MKEDGLNIALGRYLSVVSRSVPSRASICKRIGVEMEGEVWEEHERGMEEYRKILNKEPDEIIKLPERKPNLLDLKIRIAEMMIEHCEFCERKCRVNRKMRKGFCGVGYESRVATAFEHIGEEPEFIPSGTIFFSGCTFRCKFCQNWDISQYPERGDVWKEKDYCEWVKWRWEGRRIKNVNFVGGEPTPNLHNILKWVAECPGPPILWNSNMFMSEKSMKLLEGVVDVYLTDFKWGNDDHALKYSAAPKYFEVVSRNHLIAMKTAEVLIRHLVMPNHVECCSKRILRWIKDNLGDRARVNIMSQYRPEYKALEYPEIARGLFPHEYEEVLRYAEEIGLWNIETQPALLNYE